MKFGIVIFPGSNCDYDMIHVVENVLKEEIKVLWHKDTSLDDFDTNDCILLPGGFSYGDYLRSGAIARFSPIMKAVTEFANQGGFVTGICNGFQILCEAGLLPGALLHNTERKFICKNVFIKPVNTEYALTAKLDIKKAYKIPIAHGEGNFYADEKTMKQLFDQRQVLFQYCDESGNVTPESNHNGSMHNIAGICNETRNVFGMMPHPERAAEAALGNTDGFEILNSLRYSLKHIEVDVMDDLLK